MGLGIPSAMAAHPLFSSVQPALTQRIQTYNCTTFKNVLSSLQEQPGYRNASHLCKEEITELKKLVNLFISQDALTKELSNNTWDMQQACTPFNLQSNRKAGRNEASVL